MLLLWLFIAAIFLAGLVLIFGYIWYSKLFGNVMKKEHNSQKEKAHRNPKKLLIGEFGTNILHSLCIVFIFSPYSPLFGLINGLIVILGIILPFAISSSIWEGRTLKAFFVKFGHRALSLLIYFIGAGIINSFLFPVITGGTY
jgi:hypothetical protein